LRVDQQHQNPRLILILLKEHSKILHITNQENIKEELQKLAADDYDREGNARMIMDK